MGTTTVLRAKYLWDGKSNSVLHDGAILMEGGQIRAVGPAAELLTARAPTLHWPEGTLLPGLIDSHTHLSMDASLDNFLDHMSDGVPVLTLRATAMMRKDLIAGVTTCRCLGDREFLDIACRAAVANGDVSGPHLLVATRGIRSPRGHGFVGYPFEGVDEIRKAVRENISRGADLIKIYITGTLKGNGDLPAYLSREEIKVAIDEAHAAGLRVASHCVGGPGLEWALEAGLDTLEHAYHITQKQTDLLSKSHTALVLTPGAELLEHRVRRLPQSLVQGHLNERDQMFESMAMTVRARIPFAVGTDGMHGDLAEDISCLADLGATNLEAMKAATIHGAQICGIDAVTGSLEEGKRADILVVNGNPLQDLQSLRRVIAVIKNGDIVHENASAGKIKTESYVHGAF